MLSWEGLAYGIFFKVAVILILFCINNSKYGNKINIIFVFFLNFIKFNTHIIISGLFKIFNFFIIILILRYIILAIIIFSNQNC